VQPPKNFPEFYGTRRLITVFTGALHWSLSRARSIIPSHPIYLKAILILSTHLRLGFPSGPSPSGFPTNILHAFLFSTIRATCHDQFILNCDYTLRRAQVMKLVLCSFRQSPVISPLFGPDILLSTLFSNTLSQCSSLNVRVQVSHPYRTTGKMIVLYMKKVYSPAPSLSLSWSPVLPLNLTYIFVFFRNCHERTCTIQTSYIPCTEPHSHVKQNKLVNTGKCFTRLSLLKEPDKTPMDMTGNRTLSVGYRVKQHAEVGRCCSCYTGPCNRNTASNVFFQLHGRVASRRFYCKYIWPHFSRLYTSYGTLE
jgi:hypothetical protein